MNWELFQGKKNDGRIETESSKVDWMRDYIEINSGHKGILRDKECLSQIKEFLFYGRFKHQEKEGDKETEKKEVLNQDEVLSSPEGCLQTEGKVGG